MESGDIGYYDPAPEEVAIDFESPTFRGAMAVDSLNFENFGMGSAFRFSSVDDVKGNGGLAIPKLTRRASGDSSSSVNLLKKKSSFSDAERSIFGFSSTPLTTRPSVPSKPHYLVPTHFVCESDIETILSTVNRCLNDISEISYEYSDNDYKWSAVYVKDTKYCELEVFIYSDSGNPYIVEANRLTGDASAFYPFYKDLKNNLLTSCDECRSADSFASSTPMPGAIEPLSEVEAKEALAPIHMMANEDYPEAHQIAAHILCDLSIQDGIQQQLCDNGLISVLVGFAKEDGLFAQHTQRFAILALANLSDSHVCQEKMIEVGVIPLLLNLATDGPYQTAEMRRAVARILANITSRLAATVASSVDRSLLLQWIADVDNIRDSKLRYFADRAKTSLLSSGILVA